MTLNELIQRLEKLRDDFEIDGNTPITGALQSKLLRWVWWSQNYPLRGKEEAQ